MTDIEHGIPTREPQTYTIPRSSLSALNHIIDKANRRLARANVEERFEFTKRLRTQEDPENPGIYKRVADITLNTPTISAEGYSFLAVIVKEEAGFVVRTATGVELDGWRPDAMMCDHCGQRRRRNKTYLVSTPTGENMQVGSSCLRPLLGMNPAGLWALLYDLEMPDPSDSSRSPSADTDTRIPVNYIIAMALGLSQMGENFITRSAVNNGYDGTPTADSVREALFDTNPRTRDIREAQAATARRIIDENSELIAEIVASSKTENPATDYQTNMNVIMESTWAKPRNIGYVVSSVSAWNRSRELRREREDRRANATEGYVAEVGEKIRNLNVTVTAIKHFPSTDYMGNPCTTSRVNFRDEEGHEILWWSSRKITEFDEDANAVITSATVKKHDEFQGVDQTVLTRVRVKAA